MYSIDVRVIACRLYAKHISLQKISVILIISHSTISRWLKTLNERHILENKCNIIHLSECNQLHCSLNITYSTCIHP